MKTFKQLLGENLGHASTGTFEPTGILYEELLESLDDILKRNGFYSKRDEDLSEYGLGAKDAIAAVRKELGLVDEPGT